MNGTVRKSCLRQLTPVKCIGQQNQLCTVWFSIDPIQTFLSDKRFTDLNPLESTKSSSLLIVLFSTLNWRSNSRISLNDAIQCSLPTSATSRDGSLLKHLFFPLWTTFSTQTLLVFSRRRPKTRPGCLRSLLSHLNKTLFVHQEYGPAQLENDHWVAKY